MKKFVSVFCVSIMVLSLAACGNEDDSVLDETERYVSTETEENISVQEQRTEILMDDEEVADPDTSASVDLDAVRQIAQEYYADTVFEVISMELVSQTATEVVFSVCTSKDGNVQEPNRSIYLEWNGENWEVVNEGY